MISINFHTPCGNIYKTEIKNNWTVYDLKNHLSELENQLDKNNLRLYYDGLEMKPDAKLVSEFYIENYQEHCRCDSIHSQFKIDRQVTFKLLFLNNPAEFDITVNTSDTWLQVRQMLSQLIKEYYDTDIPPEHMAMIKRGRDLLYENQVSYYQPEDGEKLHVVFRKPYSF